MAICVKEAFDGKFKDFVLQNEQSANKNEQTSEQTFLEAKKDDLIRQLQVALDEHGKIWVQFSLHTIFEKRFENSTETIETKKVISSDYCEIFSCEKLEETISKCFDKITGQIRKQPQNFVLKKIDKLYFAVDKYFGNTSNSKKTKIKDDEEFFQFDVSKNKSIPLVVYVKFLELRKPRGDDKSEIQPCAFGYCLKHQNGEEYNTSSFGDNCIENFWPTLEEKIKEVLEKLGNKENVDVVPIIVDDFFKYARCFIIRGLKAKDEVEITGKVSIIKKIKLNDRIIHLQCKDFEKFTDASLMESARNCKSADIFQDIEDIDSILREEISIFPDDYDDQQLEEPFNANAMKFQVQNDSEVAQSFSRNCRTLKEYAEKYLKTKVTLMTRVFEHLRKLCILLHELDPVNYNTIASFSWKAMLKFREKKEPPLPKFKNPDVANFLKDHLRGGIKQCCKRHAKANNKEMGIDFEEDKTSKYIVTFDAINAYGWAMSESLPFKDFEMLSQEEVKKFEENLYEKLKKDKDIGYIFEIDLNYLDDLHDKHNDLPFCPEHTRIRVNGEKSLALSLNDKKNYVILDTNLKLCLDNGLQPGTIHNILKFKQQPWLKDYIYKNTIPRMKSNNKFEKDVYKKLNLVIYGKTHENFKRRDCFKVITDGEQQLRNFNEHPLERFLINENVVLVKTENSENLQDRPLPSGFAIQELSKTLLYNFHDVMYKKYQNKLKTLYMNTDSLFYEIDTDDVYQDLERDKNIQKLMVKKNPEDPKDYLGKMQDEADGKIIHEFFGTKGDSYFIAYYDQPEEPKIRMELRGNSHDRKQLTREDYERCVYDKKVIIKKRTKYHISPIYEVLTSDNVREAFITPGDYQRIIAEDDVNTYAIGHKKIRNSN